MSSAEKEMNLSALQQRDPYITGIADSATQVAIYSYNNTSHEWERTEVEGTLFVYERSAHPLNGFMIINRLHLNDLIEPINRGLEFQLQDPFLLYRNGHAAIYGIWFYDRDECARIGQLMNSLVQVATDSQTKESTGNTSGATGGNTRLRRASESDTPNEGRGQAVGGVGVDAGSQKTVDILQMLSRAQDEYEKTKEDEYDGGPAAAYPRMASNGAAKPPPTSQSISPSKPMKKVKSKSRNIGSEPTPMSAEPGVSAMLPRPTAVKPIGASHRGGLMGGASHQGLMMDNGAMNQYGGVGQGAGPPPPVTPNMQISLTELFQEAKQRDSGNHNNALIDRDLQRSGNLALNHLMSSAVVDQIEREQRCNNIERPGNSLQDLLARSNIPSTVMLSASSATDYSAQAGLPTSNSRKSLNAETSLRNLARSAVGDSQFNQGRPVPLQDQAIGGFCPAGGAVGVGHGGFLTSQGVAMPGVRITRGMDVLRQTSDGDGFVPVGAPASAKGTPLVYSTGPISPASIRGGSTNSSRPPQRSDGMIVAGVGSAFQGTRLMFGPPPTLVGSTGNSGMTGFPRAEQIRIMQFVSQAGDANNARPGQIITSKAGANHSLQGGMFLGPTGLSSGNSGMPPPSPLARPLQFSPSPNCPATNGPSMQQQLHAIDHRPYNNVTNGVVAFRGGLGMQESGSQRPISSFQGGGGMSLPPPVQQTYPTPRCPIQPPTVFEGIEHDVSPVGWSKSNGSNGISGCSKQLADDDGAGGTGTFVGTEAGEVTSREVSVDGGLRHGLMRSISMKSPPEFARMDAAAAASALLRPVPPSLSGLATSQLMSPMDFQASVTPLRPVTTTTPTSTPSTVSLTDRLAVGCSISGNGRPLVRNYSLSQRTGVALQDTMLTPLLAADYENPFSGSSSAREPVQEQLQQLRETDQQLSVSALTRDQLRQALTHLLNTDSGFLGRIHEAYVASLDRELSSSSRRTAQP